MSVTRSTSVPPNTSANTSSMQKTPAFFSKYGPKIRINMPEDLWLSIGEEVAAGPTLRLMGGHPIIENQSRRPACGFLYGRTVDAEAINIVFFYQIPYPIIIASNNCWVSGVDVGKRNLFTGRVSPENRTVGMI